MPVVIDGWSLYPNESSDAAIKAAQDKATVGDIAEAIKAGEVEVQINFDPVPDDCDKLRWFGRMLVKAFRKINAEEAAQHFEHWMSGKANQDAPKLKEETIRRTSGFRGVVADLKQKCCGAGTAEKGQTECSEYAKDWAHHVLLGGYIIYWELGARGADNCCVAKIRLDDPYDFHFGQRATFKRTVEREVKDPVFGVGVKIKANVTFSVPDEVMTKLKDCPDPATGMKPADFDRRLEFTERICCDQAPGTGTGTGGTGTGGTTPGTGTGGTGTGGTTPGTGTGGTGTGGTTPGTGGTGTGGTTPGTGTGGTGSGGTTPGTGGSGAGGSGTGGTTPGTGGTGGGTGTGTGGSSSGGKGGGSADRGSDSGGRR